MSTNNNNASILPWYSSINYQNHRKPYVYGVVWPLIAGNKKLPPFQVHRTTALTDPITTFNLVSIETGTTTDILSAITTADLHVESFTGYDLIVYHGNQAMTGVTTNEGQYYAVMGDGTNTWYSEVFFIKHDISKYLLLSFWHDEPFMFADHHISYVEPFANFVYLDTAINKPRYPAELEEDERGGISFLLYGWSDKRYRFPVLVPEYLADVLRLVPLHHYVSIYYDGIAYEVDKIVFNPGNWLDQGHLIPIEFEFQSNKTIVQVTGKVKPENAGYSYDQSAYDDSHL